MTLRQDQTSGKGGRKVEEPFQIEIVFVPDGDWQPRLQRALGIILKASRRVSVAETQQNATSSANPF